MVSGINHNKSHVGLLEPSLRGSKGTNKEGRWRLLQSRAHLLILQGKFQPPSVQDLARGAIGLIGHADSSGIVMQQLEARYLSSGSRVGGKQQTIYKLKNETLSTAKADAIEINQTDTTRHTNNQNNGLGGGEGGEKDRRRRGRGGGEERMAKMPASCHTCMFACRNSVRRLLAGSPE